MDIPLITIGIPVYNEEKYLAKTLESAINQTYKNICILISDNCSTDNSYNIAKEYEARDSRIIIFKQPNNIAVGNFEFLLEKSETEYFCFLGGHDILRENYIEDALKIFTTNSKIVGVYPLVEYFKTNIIKKLNSDTQIGGAYPQVEFMEADVIFKEDWGDRFNTLNLNTYESYRNIIGFILEGNSFYGVYKRDVMVRSFFKDQKNGFGDLGAILRASSFGYIVPTSAVCSYFRVTRYMETPEQIDLRYKSLKFPDNWRVVHTAYPFLLISHNNLISFKEKLRLNIEVQEKIKKFYVLKWSKLIGFYLRKSEFKTTILVLISYLLFTFRKVKRIIKRIIK